MQKDTRTAILFCASFLGLLVLLFVLHGNKTPSSPIANSESVRIENNLQIIDYTVRGGYSPRYVEAKAGMPTELRMNTQGTFDCSSSLVIPALGYQKILAPTGTESISVTADQAQGTLRGTCGMGMYDFEISFN